MVYCRKGWRYIQITSSKCRPVFWGASKENNLQHEAIPNLQSHTSSTHKRYCKDYWHTISSTGLKELHLYVNDATYAQQFHVLSTSTNIFHHVTCFEIAELSPNNRLLGDQPIDDDIYSNALVKTSKRMPNLSRFSIFRDDTGILPSYKSKFLVDIVRN